MSSISVLSSHVEKITILGSRFIGIIHPLDKKEDVDSYLTDAKTAYPKATHYCYAVRFDAYEYCSDDGEPSKSAGFPILSALKSEGLDRALLIVVRYFGGTKLGLSRLTKSYRDIAKITAKAPPKIEFLPGIKTKLCLDYASFEYYKRIAERSDLSLSDVQFDEKVTFFLTGSDKILMPLLERLKKEEILEIEKTEIKRRLDDDSSK